MFRNPDGTVSLSRVAFAVTLAVILAKVAMEGILGRSHIDSSVIAALLGPTGVTYAWRMHSIGVNAHDPYGSE